MTTDALGSPRIKTDASGNVISRNDYLPFGEDLYTSQRTLGVGYKPDDIRRKFTTYKRDAETDLDFAEARYYSSKWGRFVSPDEFTGGPDELFDFADDASNNPTFYADLTNPQSLNKYQYTYNNPLNMTDEDGHCPGLLRLVCNPAVQRIADKAIDAVKTSAAGTAIGAAIAGAITVLTSGENTVGDASCPACGAYERRQVLMNKNAQSQQQSQPNAGGQTNGGVGAGKNVPNPNGKKGGEKHQKEVRKATKQIKSKGLRPQQEYLVRTPNGKKSRRFVDVAGIDPKTGKPKVFVQVGKQRKTDGKPIKRERDAIDDIKNVHPKVPTK